MTQAVLAEIYRERHRLTSDAFNGGNDDILLRKGQVKGIDLILGAIEQLEAEILKGKPDEPPEDEDA